MNAAIKRLGSAITALIGLLFVFLVTFAPSIVYNIFPVQAYHLTESIAFIAFAGGLVALILALAPPARPLAGIILYAAAAGLLPFWWVWSVLIVGHHWGITTLYFLNLFLGIGALLGAVAASLFSAEWSVLGQLFLIAIMAFFFFSVASNCYPGNAES